MIRDSLGNAHAQKPQELHLSRVHPILNLRQEENRRLRLAGKEKPKVPQSIENDLLNILRRTCFLRDAFPGATFF